MSDDVSILALLSFTVLVVAVASVKGCAIVNNPETIRAEADARVLLHEKVYKK